MKQSVFFTLFLLVFFSNLLFFCMAEYAGIGRPLINLDYIAAGVLVSLRYKWIGLAFFVLALLADLLVLVGQVFPFIRLADVVYLAKFSFIAPLIYQVALVIVALAIILKVLVFYRGRGRLSSKIALFSLNAALVIYMVDVYSDDERDENRFWRQADSPLVSSQLVYFIDYRSRGFIQTYSLSGPPLSPAGYVGKANDWLGAGQLPEKMLLVVNESWGVVSQSVQADILRPLLDLKGTLIEFKEGTLPFDGATIAGELRELCKLRPNHFNLASATEGFEGCLPNKLHHAGYDTYAMHGAVSLMYDRQYWYPRVGFKHLIFFESKVWPRRCRSFPGACDLDLREELPVAFSKNGKIFFYWLTLNSHSMYDAQDIFIDRFDCEVHGISEDTETCRNLKLQAQFFEGLAEILKRDEMRGVEVIIVGDHAPPIMDLEEKARHYEKNKIPWIKFRVAEAAAGVSVSSRQVGLVR